MAMKLLRLALHFKLAAVVLFFTGLCTTVEALTLKEAVCAMLEFEPELNAAEYDTLSSREDQKIARSELYPHLSLNGSAGYSDRDRSNIRSYVSGDTTFQRDIGVSVRQLLYDGGNTVNRARSTRNAFLSQQHLEKGMIEARVVDLCEVFLEVIRTQRQIRLAETNVKNHEEMRDLLKVRVDAGGSRADLALIQGRLGLATNRLATARLSNRLAIGRFERLTGLIPENLTFPVIPQLPDLIEEIDLSKNHDYLATVEALESSEFRARATEGLNKPRLYFDAGANTGRDVIGDGGADNEVRALVVGSWDLFSSGQHRAEKEQAHLQVGKFEELMRAADLERQYRLDVFWQERQGSVSSIDALQRYATELDSVSGDYKEQFRVGRQELLNILDVQSETYTAESSLLDSQFDYDTSTFRILGVQGIATETVLGEDGGYGCDGVDKEVLEFEASYADASDPDSRVPVTQEPLMRGQFDSLGPDAPYDSPHAVYYEEREQLPVVPTADAKPKGGVFKLFRRERPQSRGGLGIFR